MNMNIRRLLAVALGLVLSCAVDAAGPRAFAKELKLATFLPPINPIVGYHAGLNFKGRAKGGSARTFDGPRPRKLCSGRRFL